MEKQFDFRIITFPRVHLTLIGLNSVGYRINGGVGFSIDNPTLIISFKLSKLLNVVDNRVVPFSEVEMGRLKNRILLVAKEFRFKNLFDVEISGFSITHFGLGTGTAAYLACIEALFIANNMEYDKVKIQMLSGRGGTSGIGINTYFNGGFVFDIGRQDKNKKNSPSSISDHRTTLPLCISDLKSPGWDLGLIISRSITNKTEEEEISFFNKVCPIKNKHVNKILYHALFGVVASLIENDYDTFCKAINELQNTKWKREERLLYSPKIDEVEKYLRKFNVDCIGMSSLGPGLFFFSKNTSDVISKIKSERKDLQVLETKMNNEGRKLEYD